MTNNCRKLCIQRNWDNDDFDLYVVFSTKKEKKKKIKEARNQTSPTYLIHGWTLNYKSIKKISTSI